MPGACWSEAQVGTNAIGTAIAEGAAVEVRGAEHYANPHRILNCSAAPVATSVMAPATWLDAWAD